MATGRSDTRFRDGRYHNRDPPVKNPAGAATAVCCGPMRTRSRTALATSAPVPLLLTYAVALALVAAGVASPGLARADVSYDGRFRQGPLREDFTVRQWLPGCGPEPQSSSTGGGEVIDIRAEGDELAFVGGGRVYRSNQCYDPMPTLARETHSRDPNGRTWRTRCTTPAGDPRRAVLNTLVVAPSDTHLDLVETGRYEIAIASGTCMADVKRTRGWDRVQDDRPAASAAPTAAPPLERPDPKPAACETPGEPARLEVRPSRKLMRTGETFQLRSLVLDAKGCATRTPTAWRLAPGADAKGVTVDGTGRVTVAADAAEGTVEIVATAAGKDTRVTIDVSDPANYDELLARSGLNASGENEAASVVGIGTQSLGAGEGRVEDRARARRLTFIGLVGGALVVLAVIGLVLLRRSRRAAALARESELRHEQKVEEVMRRRKARADQHAAQLRAHEESVAAARAASAPREPAATASPATARPAMTCPQCGREFASPTAFCPHDGVALVASGRAGASRPAEAVAATTRPSRGKICPTCGDRFDGAADFCGKDGTQLVLIN